MADNNGLFIRFKQDLLNGDSVIDLGADTMRALITTATVDPDILEDTKLKFLVDVGTNAITDAGTGIVGSPFGDPGISQDPTTMVGWTGATGAVWVNNADLAITLTADAGDVVVNLDDAVFDAPNATGTGEQILAVLLFISRATTSLSEMVGLFTSGTGIPLDDPEGSDVTIIWDENANKVFRF